MMQAFMYGQDKVTFNSLDEDALKYASAKCLRLIGFVDQSRIQRHHHMAGTDILVPEPGNGRAETALSALARAMRATGRVAIARLVKRQNSTPVLACLSPHCTDEVEGLLVDALPFIEDFRCYPFQSFEDAKAITAQATAAAAAAAAASAPFRASTASAAGHQPAAALAVDAVQPAPA